MFSQSRSDLPSGWSICLFFTFLIQIGDYQYRECYWLPGTYLSISVHRLMSHLDGFLKQHNWKCDLVTSVGLCQCTKLAYIQRKMWRKKKKSLRRFEACAGLLERCDVKCRNDHERCDVKCRNDHERGSFFSRCSQDFQWMNTCRYATDLHPFFLSLRGMERRGIVTISIMTWNHALARWCWCWQTNKQTKREQVAKDWRWWRKELTFWSVREI